MREQSKKWNSLALGYVSDAVTIVHNFVTELLRIVYPDARVRRGLISLLTDHLIERYKKAVDQVVFVLQVERSEKPATQNHYFNDTLEKWYDFTPHHAKKDTNVCLAGRNECSKRCQRNPLTTIHMVS